MEIYEVHRETLEETLQESIDLDISSLLYPNSEVDFQWRFDRMKTMSIDYL